MISEISIPVLKLPYIALSSKDELQEYPNF